MSSEFDWGDQPQSSEGSVGTHPDLKKNREHAKSFMQTVEPHLIEGMLLFLGASCSTPESLLWIKYTAPKGFAEPDYAQCINLNGPHLQVKAQVEWTFNYYHKHAKATRERLKQPKVVELRKVI